MKANFFLAKLESALHFAISPLSRWSHLLSLKFLFLLRFPPLPFLNRHWPLLMGLYIAYDAPAAVAVHGMMLIAGKVRGLHHLGSGVWRGGGGGGGWGNRLPLPWTRSTLRRNELVLHDVEADFLSERCFTSGVPLEFERIRSMPKRKCGRSWTPADRKSDGNLKSFGSLDLDGAMMTLLCRLPEQIDSWDMTAEYQLVS